MNSIEIRTISRAAALRAIEAAEAKAREIGMNACVAIVDEAGDLKAFSRMDGAPKLSIQIAQDKGYTAVSFGIATHSWWDFIKDDAPLLHGITHTPRLIVFGGGYPIKDNGKVVGGIGVSGGHYSQDMEVARSALDAIGSPAD